MSHGIVITDYETIFNEVYPDCFFFLAYNHCKLQTTIGCRESPFCFCGFHNETVKHFFLEYPLYSTPETIICSPLLLACIFADRYSLLCLKHKFYQFFCLDHCYCLRSKIMTHFFSCPVFYIGEILKKFLNMDFKPASIPLISCRFD